MEFTYIHTLTDYLHDNPHVAYFVTFLIAFGESLAIIGSVIPGSVTMTAIGAMIGSGIMPMTPTLVFAMLGAFLGDFFSYWIGAHYNERLRSIWPLNKNPRWLTLGEAFFAKHGGKSVVFGRFFGPVRSAVPLIAGMLQMKMGRFIAAALPSAMIWSLLYIFPGILVGALSLELPRATATKFILLVLCAVAFGWLIFMGFHLFCKRMLLVIDQLIEKAWNAMFAWSRMNRVTDFFNGPHQMHPHYQLTRLLCALVCLLLFLILFISVYLHGVLTLLNEPLYLLFRSFRHPWLDNAAIVITFMGDKKILLPATLLIGAGLIWRRHLKTGLIWLSVVVSGTAVAYLVKNIYFSPRPEGLLNGPTSSSFPSGHTMLAMLVYGFLAFLMASSMQSTKRAFVYTPAGIIIGLVGLSRLYLGAHWLTDVLASLLLGLAFVLLGAIFYLSRPVKPLATGKFAAASLGVILLIGLGYGIAQFRTAQYNYTLYWPETELNEPLWWQDEERNEEIPLFVASRLGKLREVLNIQWVGELDQITKVLNEHGWQSHTVDLKLSGTLQRISENGRSIHLPILPTLYQNEAPVKLFTLQDDQHRQITLMLWKSRVVIEDSNKKFWLGSVAFYAANKDKKEMSWQEIDALYDIAVKEFLASIENDFQAKVLYVPEVSQPLIMRSLHWDGELILVR
jgi:membrane protein DedA with SNARE-associated domain/membrane-associated phospholipid phosphatase